MIQVRKQGRLIGTSAVCYRGLTGPKSRYIRRDGNWYVSDANWKQGAKTDRSIEIVEWP
jgi:hypothetical protein